MGSRVPADEVLALFHEGAAAFCAEAARLAGINTDRTLLKVYVIAGFISAIAGWVLIGRVGAISPNAGENANLDSITAVVIGGIMPAILAVPIPMLN